MKQHIQWMYNDEGIKVPCEVTVRTSYWIELNEEEDAWCYEALGRGILTPGEALHLMERLYCDGAPAMFAEQLRPNSDRMRPCFFFVDTLPGTSWFRELKETHPSLNSRQLYILLRERAKAHMNEARRRVDREIETMLTPPNSPGA